VRPPDEKIIRKRYEQFGGTGSMEKRHSTGQPRRCDEDVNCVRQARRSRSRAELQLPQTSVCRILRKSLRRKPHKLLIVGNLQHVGNS
jgi:hypothetical protein